MEKLSIDINCDMGESYGRFKVGNDAKIFPYITSCNIACGFHGGDPLHMERTIKRALEYGAQIGAHPAYPDLAGFGRRNMQLSKEELKAVVKYQISALKGMVESQGGQLTYVKPHGALYNKAAIDEKESLTIIQAIQEIDPKLILMGLAQSITEEVAKGEEISFVAEAFADRKYEASGQLMSRSKVGSLLINPEEAVEQVLSIVLKNNVQSSEGTLIPIKAQSICIHGDNPSVVPILEALQEAFNQNNIIKVSCFK
ncbi:5-oxoprolinase subunit PxpA [Xanthovirga aplysinae]|uniref:5-oxoprolinase subunit PxpA n=1 Tax=Xanthovirga aplysinae TaxID=2529853 RepID=UPI0012BD3F71|nr:5-oxoprolinase subunit PxpA [Xanthovirga aplysinae]MTI30761.1 5-oxoprolinase subunit PxpA [Xanthovirga aplysinae]